MRCAWVFVRGIYDLDVKGVLVSFKLNRRHLFMLEFIGLAILIIYLFDFTKFRSQNKTMIEQNEKIIALLEDIKEKEQ